MKLKVKMPDLVPKFRFKLKIKIKGIELSERQKNIKHRSCCAGCLRILHLAWNRP